MSNRFRRMSFGFCALIAALATPITTSGQASVQTTTVSYPWEETTSLPCVGEVTVSGVFRATESTRVDSAAGSHWLLHYGLTQLRAYDANGNEWTGIHVGQVSFNPNSCETPPDCASVPFETTFVDTLLFAGHGNAPNFKATTRFHVVFNANGEVTVLFDVTDVTCSN
jgi:hypothetical protein